MKIKYCLHCHKIKEEGSDEWVETETPLEVLAGMKGVETPEQDYCDVCGPILDGIAKEQRLAQKCKCLAKGNYD